MALHNIEDWKPLQSCLFVYQFDFDYNYQLIHRELKLDGAIGHFPAWAPLKAENWSFYYITVHNFDAP